jgi:hypothetical protein
MTIHFIVPGLFGDIPTWLGGDPDLGSKYLRGDLSPGGTLPRVLVDRYGFEPVTEDRKVSYRNWLPFYPGGISGAATALGQALLAAPQDQQLLVTAHSMGSAGVLSLLDNWESGSLPVDPERILFITMGASWTTKLTWNVRKRYRILDVTVQWEKYADYPDLSSASTYSKAVANCEQGDKGTALHTHAYKTVDLDRPDRENTIGNTTFMLFDTRSEPLIPDATYDQIEAAYVRPHLKGTA